MTSDPVEGARAVAEPHVSAVAHLPHGLVAYRLQRLAGVAVARFDVCQRAREPLLPLIHCGVGCRAPRTGGGARSRRADRSGTWLARASRRGDLEGRLLEGAGVVERTLRHLRRFDRPIFDGEHRCVAATETGCGDEVARGLGEREALSSDLELPPGQLVVPTGEREQVDEGRSRKPRAGTLGVN